MKLDVIVFGAHPDDAELAMSGTIIKLVRAGLKTGIVDLSRGEMGSRGSKEIRKTEWEKASEIMGIQKRVNLQLPDGGIRPNPEFVLKAVEQIREFRPKLVFAPIARDRHPDHIGASQIVKEAFFLAGNFKYASRLNGENQTPHRPEKLFYFMQSYEAPPSFIVDISDTYPDRVKAINAYGSQFFNPDNFSDDPQTFISKPEFLEYLEARSKVYGFKIGVKYGEAFYCEEAVELDLINYLSRVKE